MKLMASLIILAAIAIVLWDEYGRAIWESWRALGDLDDSGDSLA